MSGQDERLTLAIWSAASRIETGVAEVEVDGYTSEQMAKHVRYCADDGFLELGPLIDGRPTVKRLTSMGLRRLTR